MNIQLCGCSNEAGLVKVQSGTDHGAAIYSYYVECQTCGLCGRRFDDYCNPSAEQEALNAWGNSMAKIGNPHF